MTAPRARSIARALNRLRADDTLRLPAHVTEHDVRLAWRRIASGEPLSGPLESILARWHGFLVARGRIQAIDPWLTREGRWPKGLGRVA